MTRLYRPEELPAGLAFNRGWIGAGALRVAETLQAAGFDGYLVGGCVRDILLRRRPKDFDIATDAGPEQVRGLFSRSRIIGRRFKIVHVRAGREIIEVATYRATPGDAAGGARIRLSQRGRVVDDNVFGSIEQDAARRDFTINALYYDPVRGRVADFCGGVEDARRGVLRMIGEPRARFTEDPVRMLRAARFRAKLGLAWEERLAPALADCLELLDDVPAARLFDETLKLFHYGHAVAVWDEMRAHGLAARLFPLTAAAIGDGGGDSSGGGKNSGGDKDAARAADLIRLSLDNTDRRIAEDKPVIPAFLFAVLLWRPFRRELAARLRPLPRIPAAPPPDAVWAAADTVFQKQSKRVSLPRRVSSAVGAIWLLQFELEQRRPRAMERVLSEQRFRAAFDFLELRARVGAVDPALVKWWADMQETRPASERMRASPAPDPPRPAARRRPPRSRSRSRSATRDLPKPPPDWSPAPPTPPGQPRPRSRLASDTIRPGGQWRARWQPRAAPDTARLGPARAADDAPQPAKPRHKIPRPVRRTPKPGEPESE